MTGPYRERPKLMLCPRCGEILDHAFDAVRICLRCEGVWMGTISIEKAFGDRRWPEARNTWWRNAVPCPECAMEGMTAIMNAAMVGQILIDRCYQHGLWLDHGELGRLMGGITADDRGDDDLAALRERLKIVDNELEKLLERREAWRADAEMRTKSADEYRAWLAEEQASRLAAERALEAETLRKAFEPPPTPAEREQERRLREAEEVRREAEETRARMADQKLADEAKRQAELVERAEQARLEAQRYEEEMTAQERRLRNAKKVEYKKELQRLGDVRANASARVGRLEEAVFKLRGDLHVREYELQRERERLRGALAQLEELERKGEPND